MHTRGQIEMYHAGFILENLVVYSLKMYISNDTILKYSINIASIVSYREQYFGDYRASYFDSFNLLFMLFPGKLFKKHMT